MSTKLLIILHCCKSNASQNARLIGRVTETLFNIKNTVKEENIYPANSKIQETDPIHRFYFHLVRDFLSVLTVENFELHSAAEFLCE